MAAGADGYQCPAEVEIQKSLHARQQFNDPIAEAGENTLNSALWHHYMLQTRYFLMVQLPCSVFKWFLHGFYIKWLLISLCAHME